MNIRKVKFLDNGGLTVDFDKTQSTGGTEFDTDNTVTVNQPKHPDLTKLVDKLKPSLALAYGLTGGILKYKKEIGAKNYEKTRDEILEKVTIIGLSVAGEDELQGVVISGKLKSFNDSMVAMNTPRIVYSSDKIGIEEDVAEIVDEILAEVEKYLNGKFAQLSMALEPKE